MNSVNGDLPLVNPSPEYPDPSTLTPTERQLRISLIRKRSEAGEDLDQITLRYVIDLIRCDRAGAQRERKKGKDAVKKAIQVPTIDELM